MLCREREGAREEERERAGERQRERSDQQQHCSSQEPLLPDWALYCGLGEEEVRSHLSCLTVSLKDRSGSDLSMLILEAGGQAQFITVYQTEATLLSCSAVVMSSKAFATPASCNRVGQHTLERIVCFSINSGEVFVRTCQELAAL